MNRRLLSIMLCNLLLASSAALADVNVTFDFNKGTARETPEIHNSDTVSLTLVGINPISWEYKIDLEEIDPFEKITGKIPGWFKGVSDIKTFTRLNCGEKNKGLADLGVAVDEYCGLIGWLEGAGGLNKGWKAIRYFPVAHHGSRDRTSVQATLDKLASGLSLPDFAALEKARKALDGYQCERTDEDPCKSNLALAQSARGTLANANFETARSVQERIAAYREQLAKTQSKSTAQQKTGWLGKFIVASVTEEVSKKWNVDLTAWLDATDCGEGCLTEDEKAAVRAYLGSDATTKTVRLKVEPILPVDLSIGYGIADVERVEYDVILDPTTDKNVIARTTDERRREIPTIFASFDLVDLPSIRGALAAAIGTSIENPGDLMVFGLSVRFRDRYYVSFGYAETETQELIDVMEGAEVPQGTEIPMRKVDANGAFVGLSVTW